MRMLMKMSHEISISLCSNERQRRERIFRPKIVVQGFILVQWPDLLYITYSHAGGARKSARVSLAIERRRSWMKWWWKRKKLCHLCEYNLRVILTQPCVRRWCWVHSHRGLIENKIESVFSFCRSPIKASQGKTLCVVHRMCILSSSTGDLPMGK